MTPFRTSDLALSGYLRLQGFPPVGYSEPDDSGHVELIYEDGDRLRAACAAFWSGCASVEPREFHKALRRVRHDMTRGITDAPGGGR